MLVLRSRLTQVKKPVTLSQAISYFADADRAFQYAVDLRWPDGKVTCPRCESDSNSFVKTRKLWFCNGCKKQFTVKVKTIFEDSPISLETWMTVVWMICNCKNGVSSYEIHRSLGVSQKSAWFMLHRIREAMRDDSTHKFGFGGPVESDETYVGPNPAKMHSSRKAKYHAQRGQGMRGDVYVGKTAVHGLLDRELRQVRTQVLKDVKRETLQNIILENVTPMAKVYTDDAIQYDRLGKSFVHKVIDHSKEYVRGQVHTQGIENFWSLLKRSLRGTYVAVEPFHLDAYCDEQAFRYNNRTTKDNPLTDVDRFTLAMMHAVGRRLTYAQLTGKDADAFHHPTAGTGQEEPF
jgi:transposase-like protein